MRKEDCSLDRNSQKLPIIYARPALCQTKPAWVLSPGCACPYGRRALCCAPPAGSAKRWLRYQPRLANRRTAAFDRLQASLFFNARRRFSGSFFFFNF